VSSKILRIEHSPNLQGELTLHGAKNAALVILISLVLTKGKSRLYNIPQSCDVKNILLLLKQLGALVSIDAQTNAIEIDTSTIDSTRISADLMQKTRASVLVLGPLLARYGSAEIALPGGDADLGPRPINYHIHNLRKMGAAIETDGTFIKGSARQLKAHSIILDYPSVGATENILMAATLTPGKTRIVNAALEPEVFDLITILQKMGASITIQPPATLVIEGVHELKAVEHTIIPDRLEAGSLLLAAAITGGQLSLPQARVHDLEIFLMKLQEMGHAITTGTHDIGITLHATSSPEAVSFKTGPFPGFPTDLQAPMMVAQCLAKGTSMIEETVFEDRLAPHARELMKMGAQIEIHHNKATIHGGLPLHGTMVNATNIRASCALALAGLAADGITYMSGLHQWTRGYQNLDQKLLQLGAKLTIIDSVHDIPYVEPSMIAEKGL